MVTALFCTQCFHFRLIIVTTSSMGKLVLTPDKVFKIFLEFFSRERMANNKVVREWKKDVVFREKKNRIWHYTLSDKAGNSILAAVGIEKKSRHFAYHVSADYLRAFGHTRTINAETRWSAEAGVEEWLNSLVKSNDPIFPVTSLGGTEKIPSFECPECSMTHHSNNADAEVIPISHLQRSEKSESENSEIIWSGKAWMCNKQHMHYPSFCRNGINIPVYSFVYVMGESGREYLAYVQDLYENQNCNKMVRVRWFNFLENVQDLVIGMETHAKEVFMTPHTQLINAECIDSLAIVLTPIHFHKCLKFLPEHMLSETFMSHRKLTKNNKIMQFYFSELHGYSSQPLLSSLMRNRQYIAEDYECDQPKLVQVSQHSLTFNVNDNVEILSLDSGLRGCWFRCKILCVSEECLRVQYYDVIDEDEHKNLEDIVASHRVANPDKFGMRHAGRLTIRPMPSEDKSEATKFSVGSAVDAWWCDGWWEGVLIGFDTSSSNSVELYLPGEHKSLIIESKKLRTSKDWIDGEWKNINSNPNILSSIKDLNANHTTLPTSSTSRLMGTHNSLSMSSNIRSSNRHHEP